MNEIIFPLSIFILSILLSGLFSSAETAFTAINRVKLQTLIDDPEKKTFYLQFLLKDTKKLITCILISNNITNIAAASFATAFFIDLFNSIGFTNFAAVMSSITAIVTIILLIFGEITPKTLAMKNPSNWALKISPIIYVLYYIEYPLIILFSGFSSFISKILGTDSQSSTSQFTEDEIKLLIKLGQEDGILEIEEQKMLHGVINVFDKVVREIMTPRTDMISVELTTSVSSVIALINSKGHSRIPVYEDNIDNIIGFIYAKDLLSVNPSIKTYNLRSFMREPVFIPETKQIESLLQQMRQSKFHLAIVVDEHGGVSGLVTMEDIIEEIVGEIQDEYDKEELSIKGLGPNHFIIDAGVSIIDFGTHINFSFPQDEDYDTVAGLILSELGSLPKKGQKISYQHIDFTVREIRHRRIISFEVFINEIDDSSKNESD